MAAPVDYKAHELNLYSNNSVGRLKFQDGKGTGLGPGFGQNQEYIFAKYTDDAKGQYQWPVCIPELHTIDNSTGYVIGVGWAISDGKEKLNDEKTRAESAEGKLTTDLAAESKARVDADAKLTSDLAQEVKDRGTVVSAEAKSRADADDFLQAQVGGLWGGVQTVEADSKTRDTALDVKLGVESTRASGAEAVLQSNLDAEALTRSDEIQRLDDRIDFITHNVDGAAIDSLSEIVAQFSQNGQGYASRLSYLEAVVSALVAKTQ